ncbi:HAMP domain-containing histidine kinase [Puteibacter caeruleilacunae]|nr:HAMP domain-containing histidine kinase [Puteibacter caeruleilacunae]
MKSQTLTRQEDVQQRLTGTIIGRIVGELVNPITVLNSNLQIIHEQKEFVRESASAEALDLCRDAMSELMVFLDRFAVIGRLRRREIEVKERCFDLENFLEQIKNKLEQIPSYKRRVVLSVSKDIGNFKGDEFLLFWVIVSLLDNALKFSYGDVYLEAYVDEESLWIKVKDAGIGIDMEDKPRIFDLFHRGKNAEYLPGEGIGLAIVVEALKLLKGKVYVDSDRNVSTSFKVKLPYECADKNIDHR